MEWSGTVLWVCQPWPAASLSVGWGGWVQWPGPAMAEPASVGSFMSLAADRLGTAPHSPSHSQQSLPLRWSPGPSVDLSHCSRPAHKPGCKLGCSLSGRKNSLSLEPPCFRFSPLPKAKPAHHLQGLNFAEQFLGWGLAGKGVGRAPLWQRGALGCLGSGKPWFGSAPQCLPRMIEGFLHV